MNILFLNRLKLLFKNKKNKRLLKKKKHDVVKRIGDVLNNKESLLKEK
jgi:hypothetical protein